MRKSNTAGKEGKRDRKGREQDEKYNRPSHERDLKRVKEKEGRIR